MERALRRLRNVRFTMVSDKDTHQLSSTDCSHFEDVELAPPNAKYERWNGMKIILGTMEMGRRANQEQSEEMVNLFLSQGHEELDTALMYCGGETEKILGKMPKAFQERMIISTKANPWKTGGLQFDHVLIQTGTSLTSLRVKQVDILYLHAPDHKTPIEETLKAVQQLHQERVFKRFGLSNYAAWQVAEIYYICKQNTWVLPTVYQGMFNVITRDIYKELIPTLRRLNISFYAYNPLAGGILSGKYKFTDQNDKKPVGRFFGNDWAANYRKRYWNTSNFKAVELINNALKIAYSDNSVSIARACIRWMIHHSYLDIKFGDGVIIGASNIAHLKENLVACKEGPLDPQVVKAMDQAWEICRPVCPQYFR